MAQATTYSQILQLKTQLKALDLLLSQYDWLMNSYTTDYFTLDIAGKFPSTFSKYLLDECSLADLSLLLPDWSPGSKTNQETAKPGSPPQRTTAIPPLSMLCFRKLCLDLALNQDINSLENDGMSHGGNDNNGVFGTALEKYFRVCVKAKKRHEVDLLAHMLSSLCKQNGCDHVVDIGAGLGHLSRLLTFNKHLRVTTIEASDSHSPKAQRLDKQTESLLTKQQVKGHEPTAKPNHISHWIDSNITTQEFIDLIKQDQNKAKSAPTASNILTDISSKMSGLLLDSEPGDDSLSGTGVTSDLPRFDLPWANENKCRSAMVVDYYDPNLDVPLSLNGHSTLTRYNARSLKHVVCAGVNRKRLEIMSKSKRDDRVCLSGLHACGDLSATMIKVFVNLDCAKTLSSVGCCYMKLSCEAETSSKQTAGFPMSAFVKTLPHHKNLCTYESLEMGCHFLSQYRQRLLDEESSLKRHVVRSVLQVLLYRRKDKSEIQFKRLKIKNSEKIPFKEYCEKAFQRLGVPYDLSDEEISEAEAMIETHWRAVVGAYTVRLALAPLVEAYILLDRMLYLSENGISSRLIPVFDPAISPRNMAIVAVKE